MTYKPTTQTQFALRELIYGEDRMIPIRHLWLDITDDDHDASMVLNQIFFWSELHYNDRQGWNWKTYKEWYEETRLSEYRVRKAVNKLKKLGLIEVRKKKVNGAPTLHYRGNWEVLEKLAYEKSKLIKKGEKLDSEVSQASINTPLNLERLQNGNSSISRNLETEETQFSLTENTTKTTTKSTFNPPPSAATPAPEIAQDGDSKKQTSEDNLSGVLNKKVIIPETELAKTALAVTGNKNFPSKKLKNAWDEIEKNIEPFRHGKPFEDQPKYPKEFVETVLEWVKKLNKWNESKGRVGTIIITFQALLGTITTKEDWRSQVVFNLLEGNEDPEFGDEYHAADIAEFMARIEREKSEKEQSRE